MNGASQWRITLYVPIEEKRNLKFCFMTHKFGA